ncbi:hypothetical protein [Sphingosinicella sp.]|uniref:hypothetical protein n=1 Tax=Sphingosinicella sp. TaxID=1917971 RepID=UPI0017F00181|nr:hypothetical protein [Sphingosinicella sp.]MBA4757692.1 hypothetical protein [Sphingosinicella sp.]
MATDISAWLAGVAGGFGLILIYVDAPKLAVEIAIYVSFLFAIPPIIRAIRQMFR